MSKIPKIPKIPKNSDLIKNINNNACNVCQTGSAYNVCKVPLTDKKTDEKCEKSCSSTYNASSYYYDKDGTKRCYCGKTKISCEIAGRTTYDCDGKKNDMWIERSQQDSQEFFNFLISQLEEEVGMKCDFIPGANFDFEPSSDYNPFKIITSTK